MAEEQELRDGLSDTSAEALACWEAVAEGQALPVGDTRAEADAPLLSELLREAEAEALSDSAEVPVPLPVGVGEERPEREALLVEEGLPLEDQLLRTLPEAVTQPEEEAEAAAEPQAEGL